MDLNTSDNFGQVNRLGRSLLPTTTDSFRIHSGQYTFEHLPEFSSNWIFCFASTYRLAFFISLVPDLEVSQNAQVEGDVVGEERRR